jgi:ketosteroid isomerase-like protein
MLNAKPMNTRREIVLAAVAAAGLSASACTTTAQESIRMATSVTAESVVQFLNHFEELAMKEDFRLLEDMIDERAYFRFNDGDFVGRKAIQAAFEKTWRGDPTVKKARFYLSEIVVLTTDRASASATYTYNWEGAQGGREFKIQGRGTRVLAHEGGRFRIVHEHLSRLKPKINQLLRLCPIALSISRRSSAPSLSTGVHELSARSTATISWSSR